MQAPDGAMDGGETLDPAIARSLQVQAAALRRTVSTLNMQASATEQGLLRRILHTEQAELAQFAAFRQELDEKSGQVHSTPSEQAKRHKSCALLSTHEHTQSALASHTA